jgi:hypothetical protein
MNTIAKNKTIGNEVLARGSEIEGAQATNITRPLLKWAGGKTQLLGEIIPKIPKNTVDLSNLFSVVVARCFLLCIQQAESLLTATRN